MVEIKHNVLGVVGAPEEKEERQDMTATDLKSLIELGCIRESVEIDGRVFVMKTLGSLDRVKLAGEYNQDATDAEKFIYNIQMLAYSLESIDGKPTESYHSSPKKDILGTKMEIIGALQMPVIVRLLAQLTKMMERCDAQYDIGEIKN